MNNKCSTVAEVTSTLHSPQLSQTDPLIREIFVPVGTVGWVRNRVSEQSLNKLRMSERFQWLITLRYFLAKLCWLRSHRRMQLSSRQRNSQNESFLPFEYKCSWNISFPKGTPCFYVQFYSSQSENWVPKNWAKNLNTNLKRGNQNQKTFNGSAEYLYLEVKRIKIIHECSYLWRQQFWQKFRCLEITSEMTVRKRRKERSVCFYLFLLKKQWQC